MIRTITRSIYDFSKKHIIIYAIFISLPSIYFPILEYYGLKFGLTNMNKELTKGGSLLTIFLMLSSLFLVLFRLIADKYDSEITENGKLVLGKLLNIVNQSRENKYHYYKSFITDTSKISICKHMAPANEINRALNQFRNMLSDITGIVKNNIGISVYYKYRSQSFLRISTDNIDSDIDKIVNKPGSTISYMRTNDISKVFFPNKKVGISKKQYIRGSKDEANDSIGSIYCEKIRIGDSQAPFVESYLVITTYGYQICSENDKNTQNKFEEIIIPVLKDQIRVELTKLYISEKKECPKKHTNT